MNAPFHDRGPWNCRGENGHTFADTEDRFGDWGCHLDDVGEKCAPDTASIVVRDSEKVVAIVVRAGTGIGGRITPEDMGVLASNAELVSSAPVMRDLITQLASIPFGVKLDEAHLTTLIAQARLLIGLTEAEGAHIRETRERELKGGAQ